MVSSLFWDMDPAVDPTAPTDTLGVLIRDAKTGRLIKRIDTGPCGTELVEVTDTTAFIQPPAEDHGPDCYGSERIERLVELDLATGRQRDLSPDRWLDWAMTRDGRFVGYVERPTIAWSCSTPGAASRCSRSTVRRFRSETEACERSATTGSG